MVELVIVGGGKMGEALAGGLLAAAAARGDRSSITVVEPVAERRAELVAAHPGLSVVEQPVAADGAIIAVKPEFVADVAATLGGLRVPRLLSIAAGVTTARIESEVPAGTAVVRAMPNTPSLIGRGATAIAGGTAAGEGDLAWARELLGSVGIVLTVTEDQLDAVTGLSGSGPAYVFLLAEALIDAGVEQGLPRDTASRLAVQTLRGAAELLDHGDAPAELRHAVTSPGGTTAAGLRALEDGGLRATIAAAVAAAASRSRDLR